MVVLDLVQLKVERFKQLLQYIIIIFLSLIMNPDICL